MALTSTTKNAFCSPDSMCCCSWFKLAGLSWSPASWCKSSVGELLWLFLSSEAAGEANASGRTNVTAPPLTVPMALMLRSWPKRLASRVLVIASLKSPRERRDPRSKKAITCKGGSGCLDKESCHLGRGLLSLLLSSSRGGRRRRQLRRRGAAAAAATCSSGLESENGLAAQRALVAFSILLVVPPKDRKEKAAQDDKEQFFFCTHSHTRTR